MTEYDDLQLLADKWGMPLAVAAYQFLRGGGTVSLSEAVGLSPRSGAALSVAGHRLHVERAVNVGLACEGDTGRAQVRAEIDGGESLKTRAVESLVDAAEEALNVLDR